MLSQDNDMGTRLISAGVGIVIALIILFLHNTILFPIAVGAVAVILSFEFLRANGMLRYRLLAAGALGYAFFLPLVTVGLAARLRMMLTVVCASLVLVDSVRCRTKLPTKKFFGAFACMFLIANSLSTAVILNHSHEQHGVTYVVLALCGAWIADSSAYFVGRYFGKTPLAPSISPKKTVEGFLGGIAGNIVFFVLFSAIYQAIFKLRGTPIAIGWFSTIIMGAVCALLGTLGDLSASVLKRQLGIKDYGNFMPGHGGLLDRFDSVLLVLPFFCAYVQATSFFNLK